MIKLIENYAVKVDNGCYTLILCTGKFDKNNKEIYKTIGYYSCLESAVRGCIRDLNNEQLSKGTHSLEEAVKIITTNNDILRDLLSRSLGVE